MTHRKLACAALLALSSASALATETTAFDLALEPSSITVAETLTDVFTFTLSSESGITLNVAAATQLRSLEPGTLQLIGPSGTFQLFGRVGEDGLPVWSFAARSLMPGQYTVVAIGGIDTPKLYTSDLDVEPLPVPEPASLPLMAAGMAGIGLLLRRSRR
jgi:hypothetical protein